jgi:hypothetical protein
VLAIGASQPPGPPQRCRAHQARATPAQSWCETPRKEWPGSKPSPVARPRPAQAGRQAAATRICFQLSTLGACLFADGTHISQPVPANGISHCSRSRIVGIRVKSRRKNRSGTALPLSCSRSLPAPAVTLATTPPPQRQRRLDPQGFARLHRAATGPAYLHSPLLGKQQPAHFENIPNEWALPIG